MKLVEKNVIEFIESVDSKSPAPGGGSVSALASSLGIALSRMVGHLTVGKKKFRALDQEIQTRFVDTTNELLDIKNQMTKLIDKDTDAFNLIMAAFKMPKETDVEKGERKAKILEGTIEAIKVPYEVATLSYEVLKKMEFILAYGNKNTLSDIGVSTLLIYSGIEGAILNVKINIPGLDDLEMIKEYSDSVEQMLSDSKNIKDKVMSDIHKKL